MAGNNTHHVVAPNPFVSYTFWKVLLLVGVVFCILPLIAIFSDLSSFDRELFRFLLKIVIPRYFFNTLVISLLVEIGVVLVGSSIAWITALYDFPLRKIVILLQLFPLLMPSYISALVWKNGIITNIPFLSLFAGDKVHLYSNFMILIIVLVCNLYPYVFLILYTVFSSIPQSMVDVAKNLNQTKRKRSLFLCVGLPFAKVSMIGAMLLVFMELFNGFWVYQYLGYETIATGIIRVWHLYGNLSIAKVIAAFVILLMSGLVLIKNFLEQRQHRYISIRGKSIIPSRVFGWKSYAILLGGLFPVFLGFVIPFVQILGWAAPIVLQGRLSYNIIDPVKNSILLVLAVVAIQIPLSILFTYAVGICRGIFFKRCFLFLSLGYAIPSALVALLIIGVIKWFDVLVPSMSLFSLLVNGSWYALIMACVFRYIPIALTPIRNGFHQTNVRFEEASRSLGGSAWRTLVKVCLPINRKFIFTASMLTVIDVVKDIPITSILHPFNFSTLALKLYQLVNNEQLTQASVSALLLVVSGTALILPVYMELIKDGKYFD